MRICMVSTFYPPFHFGGDAIFVRGLADALGRQGHDVHVVHCEDAFRICGGKADALVADDTPGVTVHRLRSRWGKLSPMISQQTGGPGIKRAQLQRIFSQPFDVVNFHNTSLMGGPSVLAMGCAPVKLYTLHEHWLICPTHILWKNRERACDKRQCFTCSLRSGVPPQLWRSTSLLQRKLAHVDALISPSEYTAKRHRDAGIDRPIQIIPNFSPMITSFTSASGVDDLPTDVARDGVAGSRPRFIFVGRVTASKGVEHLAATFAQMPEYDLIIAGDGDLRQPLAQRYAKHSNIEFVGPLPLEKLAQHYRQAIAMILSSLAPETFGLCVIEAMACGTPAIVHDAGGCRETVERTQGGLIYRNADELRKAVTMLAKDSTMRDKLARQGREVVLRDYTEARYVDQYLTLIDSIRAQKQLV